MIKGIDAQVMIQRSVEYARQSADHVNNAQQAQDFINRLEKEQAAQNLSTVTKSDKAEQEKIKRDKEKGASGGGAEQRKKEEKNGAEERDILDDVSRLEAGYVPKSRLDIEI
ncbi:MAG: hypothetical protein DBX46_05380 [Clostridiales bacterium]|jgi:hypothetical protein|nr:MAG: hypothetical protein DBX46_05380 [Clostridiales bacterium]